MILQACYSVSDFAQMAGRGARDRAFVCNVEIVYWDSYVHPNEQAIGGDFLEFRDCQVDCRRYYLDHLVNGCGSLCGMDDTPCDNCERTRPGAVAVPHTRQRPVQVDKPAQQRNVAISVMEPPPVWPLLATPSPAQPASGNAMGNPYRKQSMLPKHQANMAQVQQQLDQRMLQVTSCTTALVFRTKAKNFEKLCASCYLRLGRPIATHKVEDCPHHSRNVCYSCWQGGCFSCAAKPSKQVPGICNRCYMSVKEHRGFRYGEGCPLIQNGFTRTFAIGLYFWRPNVMHYILGQLQVTAPSSFESYVKWLVRIEPPETEMNMLRVVVYFMEHVTACEGLRG